MSALVARTVAAALVCFGAVVFLNKQATPLPSDLRGSTSIFTPQRGYTHCTNVLDLRGTWDASRVEPFFLPDPSLCDAPRPLVTPASLAACLVRRGKNRPAKLFFAGNSLARGVAFTLSSWMLGNTVAPRSDQMKTCLKAPDGVHEHCQIPLSDGASPAAFMWRDAWGDTGVIPPRKDWCFNKSAVACHAAFFGADSDPGDVFITNIARGYLESAFQRGLGVNQGFLNATLGDLDQFIASRVFAGTVVWATSPRAHPNNTYGGYNEHTDRMNDFYAGELRQRGVSVMDHAHFISESTPPAGRWVDAIHPPTESYLSLVQFVLSDICDASRAA